MNREDWDEYPEDEGEHIDGVCEACGEKCTSVTQDDGIGPFEYWGSKGVHHEYVEVSPCCQAEVIDEPELEEVEA